MRESPIRRRRGGGPADPLGQTSLLLDSLRWRGFASASSCKQAGAGLAGLFPWHMVSLADRDLFCQDPSVLPAGALPPLRRLGRVDGDALLLAGLPLVRDLTGH